MNNNNIMNLIIHKNQYLGIYAVNQFNLTAIKVN